MAIYIWDSFNVTPIIINSFFRIKAMALHSTYGHMKSEFTKYLPCSPLIVCPSPIQGIQLKTILSSAHQRRNHLCAMLIVTLNKYSYSWDQRYKMSVPNPPMMAHIPDRWQSLAEVIKACKILESYFATLERIQVGD